jgi:hypothetical protein
VVELDLLSRTRTGRLVTVPALHTDPEGALRRGAGAAGLDALLDEGRRSR